MLLRSPACGVVTHAASCRLRRQENRLLRDTPFLCDFHFRNDLPLPPIGPKFLPIVVDRARMTAYQPYGLVWDKPQEAPLERDLGISLDPLDAERYRIPPGSPPALDPEDEALIAPDTAATGPGFRQVNKGKKTDQKAGWLMRTLYLSDMQLPKVRAGSVHGRACVLAGCLAAACAPRH